MHGRSHSEKPSGPLPSVEPGHVLCRDTALTVGDGSASCFLSCSTHWRNSCRWTRWSCGVLGRPCGPGWSSGSNPKYRDSFAVASQPLRRCSVDFCLCYPESLATNPRRENREGVFYSFCEDSRLLSASSLLSNSLSTHRLLLSSVPCSTVLQQWNYNESKTYSPSRMVAHESVVESYDDHDSPSSSSSVSYEAWSFADVRG